MPKANALGRFSIGVGDRFAHQASAQLRACIQAAEAGAVVVPVWNKSNREHSMIGSEPSQTRTAADAAVRRFEWRYPYFCDADHINLRTVDRFLEPCDFFTIDVAEQIGAAPEQTALDAFIHEQEKLIGSLVLPGIEQPVNIK
jgi:tagaturonate epimerase